MPQIGSNIYAIGMITALRDYVRLLRAISMLTLSSHHRHHPFSPLLCSARLSLSLSLSLSLFLSLSLSLFFIVCFCLFVPISVVLYYVPYKRQIRVIKRLGHGTRALFTSCCPCNFRFRPSSGSFRFRFVCRFVDSLFVSEWSLERDDFLLW